MAGKVYYIERRQFSEMPLPFLAQQASVRLETWATEKRICVNYSGSL